MKLMTDGRKALLAAAALVACVGFTFNAQAQTCVVTNWAGGQVSLNDADAGTQVPVSSSSPDNRRYGGPCGLRVPVDGTARYVVDNTPANETTYIARFYAYLDSAGTNPVRIFEASDGTTNQIEVWYNQDGTGAAAAGALSMTVATTGGSVGLDAGAVGSGWHSIELVWAQGATAGLILSVDGTDINTTADTGSNVIADAALGNLNAASGGSIDFDDFDSRRVERPGRLLVGDADANATVEIFDVISLRDELLELAFAPGQPDCNEDGAVDIFDAICLRNKLL